MIKNQPIIVKQLPKKKKPNLKKDGLCNLSRREFIEINDQSENCTARLFLDVVVERELPRMWP
jgi:hypothetical protein